MGQQSLPYQAAEAGAEARTFGRYSALVVALCCVINTLDGFDTLCMSYVAPLLSRQWHLAPTMLGLVFSSALAGMAIGAFFVAPLADRIGRRFVMLTSLSAISLAMLLTAAATELSHLVVLRLIAGIGIGSLLATLNTVVSEYSPDHRRNLSLSIMHVGYGIGAGIAGFVAIFLISTFGWRSVFIIGGVLSALMIPATMILLPESIDFLLARRPRHALASINAVRSRLGQPPLTKLPPVDDQAARTRPSVASLLNATWIRDTSCLWIASFTYALTLYFLLSWTPQVLSRAGVASAAALVGGAMLAIFGSVGSLLMGLSANRFGLRRLTILAFVACAIAMAAFGYAPSSAAVLVLLSSLIGVFIVAGFTGMMATTTRLYPAAIRNTGLGWIVGVGRIGAFTGPYVAGVLMAQGWTRAEYYLLFAAVIAISAVSIACTRKSSIAADATMLH